MKSTTTKSYMSCCSKRPPFLRLVWEIGQDTRMGADLRWQSSAILALQEMTEAFIVREFTSKFLINYNANLLMHAID